MRRQWVRPAGSRRYHLEREDWRSGRAVCGANIARPYVSWDGPGLPSEGYVKLADYPRTYGRVKPCGHCQKKERG